MRRRTPRDLEGITLLSRKGAAGVGASRFRRRRARVLGLDVVGFSTMMAPDDLAAVSALHERRSIVADRTQKFGGRIFGAAGDSFMIEYGDADADTASGFLLPP